MKKIIAFMAVACFCFQGFSYNDINTIGYITNLISDQSGNVSFNLSSDGTNTNIILPNQTYLTDQKNVYALLLSAWTQGKKVLVDFVGNPKSNYYVNFIKIMN